MKLQWNFEFPLIRDENKSLLEGCPHFSGQNVHMVFRVSSMHSVRFIEVPKFQGVLVRGSHTIHPHHPLPQTPQTEGEQLN